MCAGYSALSRLNIAPPVDIFYAAYMCYTVLLESLVYSVLLFLSPISIVLSHAVSRQK